MTPLRVIFASGAGDLDRAISELTETVTVLSQFGGKYEQGNMSQHRFERIARNAEHRLALQIERAG